MFTGIVEELGRLESRIGDRFVFNAKRVLEDASLGDSIAVNGCCLTVVQSGETVWEADVSSETKLRTTLDRLQPGDALNFERPVRLQDRLGGHLVQGHVDGVGEVVRPGPDLVVRLPEKLTRYAVEKGSIALDGVSLTIVQVDGEHVSVSLIPHTMAVTTLGMARPRTCVNVEVDIMAKYAERLLSFRRVE